MQDELKLLERYFDRLWPICRSITGNGLRESFKILSEVIPLEVTEIPSGTQVFDWIVPKEWNISDAYIITPTGQRICEFKKNNLHVVSYSVPVNTKMPFAELKRHLYSLPDRPEAIPYMTSYYKEDWGFCISHNELLKLPSEGQYEVVIESELTSGSLTYGEAVLKGSSDREILFSSYLCHPSMANNELSGPLALAFLYKRLAAISDRKYTYRFVIAPETIGVISYLANKGNHLLAHLDAGYVLTCCGDKGGLTYKRSRRGNTLADRVAEHILKFRYPDSRVIDFAIGGSDERQYCSSGFNLPVGSLMRTPYKEFKEYHTSMDNKQFISFNALKETIDAYEAICFLLELNENYRTTQPWCEPQLGKRGLYPDKGGHLQANVDFTHNLLHFLSYADGQSDLVTIAEKKNICALAFGEVIQQCNLKGLL